MRHTLRVSFALLSFLAATALAACGAGAVSPTAAAPTVIPPTATQEPITEASQLVGIWQTYSPHCKPGYMIIRPDGSLTWSCQRDGSSGITGKYRFEGNRFVVLNDLCGVEGIYEVRAASNEAGSRALVFNVVKDDCAAEVETFATQKATWDSALP